METHGWIKAAESHLLSARLGVGARRLRNLPLMRPLQLSSGDLLVDRRAGFAAALARSQDFAAAAEILADAMELAPHWAAGWQLLGDYRSHAGDLAGAGDAYRHVQRLDTHAIFGATLTLAAHGAGAMPVGTDVGYVETLFDEYAGRFDRELVEDLSYTLPPAMARATADLLAGSRVARAVDLGCGTGLVGAEIRSFCDRLEGVDLSRGMLAQARRKAIYDRLERAELVWFLAADPGGIGLLTAADVLNYCGELPPVLSAAFAALAPGGLFALSLELHDGAGTLLQRRQLRYAHNHDEAVAECRAAGFEIVRADRTSTRRERDVPVDGLLMVLRRPLK
jgi:predicted TPR repeat methyltransferase